MVCPSIRPGCQKVTSTGRNRRRPLVPGRRPLLDRGDRELRAERDREKEDEEREERGKPGHLTCGTQHRGPALGVTLAAACAPSFCSAADSIPRPSWPSPAVKGANVSPYR